MGTRVVGMMYTSTSNRRLSHEDHEGVGDEDEEEEEETPSGSYVSFLRERGNTNLQTLPVYTYCVWCGHAAY